MVVGGVCFVVYLASLIKVAQVSVVAASACVGESRVAQCSGVCCMYAQTHTSVTRCGCHSKLCTQRQALVLPFYGWGLEVCCAAARPGDACAYPHSASCSAFSVHCKAGPWTSPICRRVLERVSGLSVRVGRPLSPAGAGTHGVRSGLPDEQRDWKHWGLLVVRFSRRLGVVLCCIYHCCSCWGSSYGTLATVSCATPKLQPVGA